MKDKKYCYYRILATIYLSNVEDFMVDTVHLDKLYDSAPKTSTLQLYQIKIHADLFQMGMISRLIDDIQIHLVIEKYYGYFSVDDAYRLSDEDLKKLEYERILDRRFTAIIKNEARQQLNTLNGSPPKPFILGRRLANGDDREIINKELDQLNLGGEHELKITTGRTLEFDLIDTEWTKTKKVIIARSFHNCTVGNVLESLLVSTGLQYYMEIPDNQDEYLNIPLLNNNLPQSILNIDRDYGIYKSGLILSFDPNTQTIYLLARYPEERRPEEAFTNLPGEKQDLVKIRVPITSIEDKTKGIDDTIDSIYETDAEDILHVTNNQPTKPVDRAKLIETHPSITIVVNNRMALANILYIRGNISEVVPPFSYMIHFPETNFPNGQVIRVEYDPWNNPYGVFAKGMQIVANTDMISVNMERMDCSRILPMTCFNVRHYENKDPEDVTENSYVDIDSDLLFLKAYTLRYTPYDVISVNERNPDRKIYLCNAELILVRDESIASFRASNESHQIFSNNVTELDRKYFLGFRKFWDKDRYRANAFEQDVTALSIDRGLDQNVAATDDGYAQSYKINSNPSAAKKKRLAQDGHSLNDKMGSASPGGYKIGNNNIEKSERAGDIRIYWEQRNIDINNLLKDIIPAETKRYISMVGQYGCFMVSCIIGTMRTVNKTLGKYGENIAGVTFREFAQIVIDALESGFILNTCSVQWGGQIGLAGLVCDTLVKLGRITSTERQKFKTWTYRTAPRANQINMKKGFVVTMLDTIYANHFVLGSNDGQRVVWDPYGDGLVNDIRGLTNKDRRYRIVEYTS